MAETAFAFAEGFEGLAAFTNVGEHDDHVARGGTKGGDFEGAVEAIVGRLDLFPVPWYSDDANFAVAVGYGGTGIEGKSFLERFSEEGFVFHAEDVDSSRIEAGEEELTVGIKMPKVHPNGGSFDNLAETFFGKFKDTALLTKGFGHFVE